MMNKTILSSFVLIILLGLPFRLKAQPSSPDSLSTAYQQKLTALDTEFRKEGFRLSKLMEDHRFEVYQNIDDKFSYSAERTTPTLEEYKEILRFKEKVKDGVEFIENHSRQLQKAEKEYHIPKYLITAILGIESDYGKVLGTYNPFNVYISMILVSHRPEFAKEQLKELLEFVERKDIDIYKLKSSYAGAMSPAQFIPYSVNKWWEGKNIFDIDNSIMSIGNYLAYFKKRTKDLRTTILRYNPSGLYADTILDLASKIEEKSDIRAHK